MGASVLQEQEKIRTSPHPVQHQLLLMPLDQMMVRTIVKMYWDIEIHTINSFLPDGWKGLLRLWIAVRT
jgi:hypothetical protein